MALFVIVQRVTIDSEFLAEHLGGSARRPGSVMAIHGRGLDYPGFPHRFPSISPYGRADAPHSMVNSLDPTFELQRICKLENDGPAAVPAKLRWNRVYPARYQNQCGDKVEIYLWMTARWLSGLWATLHISRLITSYHVGWLIHPSALIYQDRGLLSSLFVNMLYLNIFPIIRPRSINGQFIVMSHI